jgi:aspartate/glutamate racemase
MTTAANSLKTIGFVGGLRAESTLEYDGVIGQYTRARMMEP